MEELPTEASKGGVGHNTSLSPKDNNDGKSKDTSDDGSVVLVEIEYGRLKQEAEIVDQQFKMDEKQKEISDHEDDFKAKILDPEEQKRQDEEAKRRREDKYAKLAVRIPNSNPGCSEICFCSVL